MFDTDPQGSRVVTAVPSAEEIGEVLRAKRTWYPSAINRKKATLEKTIDSSLAHLKLTDRLRDPDPDTTEKAIQVIRASAANGHERTLQVLLDMQKNDPERIKDMGILSVNPAGARHPVRKIKSGISRIFGAKAGVKY